MGNEMGNQVLELEGNEPEEVEDDYKIRTYRIKDLPEEYGINLILAPFLNTYKQSCKQWRWVDRDAYFLHYGAYVRSIISRPESKVRIGIVWDEKRKENVVIGWCLFENMTVHYAWVKEDMRFKGIFKDLLPKEFNTVSHMTEKASHLWRSKYPYVKNIPWA